MNTLKKQYKVIEKIFVIFLLSATFALLFQLETNLLTIFTISLLLTLVNTLVGKIVLSAHEKVIVTLYSIIIFVTQIVLVNLSVFLTTGHGANNQMTVFYFSLSLAIFLTVYDFYHPNTKEKKEIPQK